MKRNYVFLFLIILIFILPVSIVVSTANNSTVCASVAANVSSDVYSSASGGLDLNVVKVDKKVTKPKIKPPVNPKKFAYLTFDDGPNPTVTAKVLEVLDEYDVKATFFMLGSSVDAYPSVAKSVYSKGHTIGNHTYSHRWNKIRANFRTEISKTNKAIEKAVGGYKVKFFRTPYGYKLQSGFKKYLHSLGMKIYLWNVDCKDSRAKRVPADTIYNSVAWSLEGKKDVVIIMHDGSGHIQTAYALPRIIEELYKKGYGIKPLTVDTKVNAKVEVK